MAIWKAEVRLTNSGFYFPVTVEAPTVATAKETIHHIYNPITIRNLRCTGKRSFSSGTEIGGTSLLIGLVVMVWLFSNFAHFILMGIGGFGGAWIAQLLTGQSLSDYSECDEEDASSHIKFMIMLILSLILGGVGYVKGLDVKNHIDNVNQTQQTEIKQK